MDIFKLIEKRRSVRKFTDEEIPEDILKKCLEYSLLAPNSSNLQPWEFYWIRSNDKKNKIIESCFSQNAAKTAKEIIVAVSRIDTWKRNKNLLVKFYESKGNTLPIINKYYNKLIPLIYTYDKLGITTFLRRIAFAFINIIGIFKPVMRGPISKRDRLDMATKTTALACQNLMMTLVNEGFDSCPMEGFDQKRVKKILNLNSYCNVVMILGIGKADSKGIYSERFRINNNLTIKEV